MRNLLLITFITFVNSLIGFWLGGKLKKFPTKSMEIFAGIVLIFIGALVVNKITGNSKKKSYFIIELPEYKMPSFKRAFFSMCSRGKAYIVKAGTIILVCNVISLL